MSVKALEHVDRFSIMILRLLSMEPLKSYYQREIAKKSGVSVGKTNQVLRLFEKEEIILKERRGKVDLYKYNLRNPVARYMKIIFNLSEISELVKKLRSASNKVTLFGSSAEGTDSKESDIDLLILARNKKQAEKALYLARRSIRRRISPVVMSPIEFSELRERDRAFYEQVSKGIIVWQLEE